MPGNQMTAAEAYLEGFSDGYHGKERRYDFFESHSFGDRYSEAYFAGTYKRDAEKQLAVETVPVFFANLYSEKVGQAEIVEIEEGKKTRVVVDLEGPYAENIADLMKHKLVALAVVLKAANPAGMIKEAQDGGNAHRPGTPYPA